MKLFRHNFESFFLKPRKTFHRENIRPLRGQTSVKLPHTKTQRGQKKNTFTNLAPPKTPKGSQKNTITNLAAT